MEKIICTLLLFCSFSLHSQNQGSSDTLYLHVEEKNLKDINDVYIQDFTFHNPTLNPELFADKFLPTTENIHYVKNELNGKVKKLSKWVKYPGQSKKQLKLYSLFNKLGLKTQSNERGYIQTFFYYDSENRLSKKVRIVDNDTTDTHDYLYNERSQLIKCNNFIIEYDSLHRPIYAKDEKYFPNGIEYKVNYDHNIVEVEEIYKGKSMGKKKYIYSNNHNLIKKDTYSGIYYYSYNSNNQLIKEVLIKNNRLKHVRKYWYNEHGDQVYQSFQFAKDLEDGTIAEQILKYEYDYLNNVIYKHSSGDIINPWVEYYYEIEYH